ncbi:MAG: ankyrin repeat domain-containing protein [Gammaproteobacteria bacterium]|nr:ankyrin repeat domain-containing protein [Gammaproteobacteria bacterium]
MKLKSEQLNPKLEKICSPWRKISPDYFADADNIKKLNEMSAIFEEYITPERSKTYDSETRIRKALGLITALYYCYKNVAYPGKDETIKKEIDKAKAALLDVRELDKIDPVPFCKMSQNYPYLTAQLAELRKHLDRFKPKVMGWSSKLYARYLSKDNKFAYRALENAYAESLRDCNLNAVNLAIAQEAGNFQGNRFSALINYDMFRFCKAWRERNKTFELVSTPKPRQFKNIKQAEGYLLTEKDINLGLIILKESYEAEKSQATDLPPITFLPIQSEPGSEFISDSIKARGCQSYIGIYHKAHHYVLNFIHKWPSGRTTVVLVDPAPHSKYKTQTLQESAQAFAKAIPGCDVVALDIVQQFNGSDCGICNLQTAQDIINSFIDPEKNTFFDFRDEKLFIDPLALRLNAENFRHREQEMVVSCVLVRFEWESALKEEKKELAIFPNEEDYIYCGEYDFESQKNQAEYDSSFSSIAAEFQRSKFAKELLPSARIATIRLQAYEDILEEKFSQFKKFSPTYANHKDKLAPNFSEKFDDDIKHSIRSLELKPIIFERLAEAFLSQYKDKLFPDNTYVDVRGFAHLEKETQNRYEDFIKRNPEYAQITAHPDFMGCSKYVQSKITQHAKKIYCFESNLEKFQNQPLTYGLLQQCRDILQRKHRFFKPELLRIINKLLAHKKAGLPLETELDSNAAATLKFFMQKYKDSNKKDPGVLRTIDAIRSTTTCNTNVQRQQGDAMTFEEVKDEITKGHNKNVSNRSLISYTLGVLEHIKQQNEQPDESNSLFLEFDRFQNSCRLTNSNYNVRDKGGAGQSIGMIHLGYHGNWDGYDLHLIRDLPSQETLENYYGNCYLLTRNSTTLYKISETGQATKLNIDKETLAQIKDFLLKNKEIKVIREKHTSESLGNLWKQIRSNEGYTPKPEEQQKNVGAKHQLNNLVESFVGAYSRAKQHDRVSEFLSEIYNTGCVEARIKPALEWATKLETFADLDTVMARADIAATQYLTSIGKSASYENKFHFILKHYKGVKVVSKSIKYDENFKPIEKIEKIVKISKKLIEEHYADVEQKATLKSKHKKDLIDIYNNYNLQHFQEALAVADLKTPGLHKPNSQGLTLLTEACRKGRFEHVQALIYHGINLNSLNTKGESVWTVTFDAPTQLGLNPDGAPILCRQRVFVTLFSAINSPAEKERIAKDLLLRAYTSSAQDFGTILHYISDNQYLYKPVESLDNVSFLVDACLNKKKNHIKVLIDKKIFDMSTANISVPPENKSLIQVAAEKGDDELIKALIEAIEDKTKRSEVLEKLFIYFTSAKANYASFEVFIEYALQAEKSLDAVYAGQTLLTQACLSDEPAAVKFLLKQNETKNEFPSNNAKQLLLQIAFDNSQSVFFVLAKKMITDADERAQFYDNNLEKILQSEDFLADFYFARWEKAGLFAYLNEKFDFAKVKPLLEYAIKNNQPMCVRGLISTMRGNAEFKEALPNLLLHAQTNSNPAAFELLLSAVTNFDVPGLNLPWPEGGSTLITLACQDQTPQSLKILELLAQNKEVNLVNAEGGSLVKIAVIQKKADKAKILLDRLASRSTQQMFAAVENDDLLLLAYKTGNYAVFNEIFSRFNNLNVPGLALQSNQLEGGTFLSDIMRKPDSFFKRTIIDDLLWKGQIPSNAVLASSKFKSIYSNVIHEADATFGSADKQFFLENYLYPIIHTVDINRKLSLIIEARMWAAQYEYVSHHLKELEKVIRSRSENIQNSPAYHCHGYSSLHKACSEQTDFVPLLENQKELKAGAQPDALYGKTALHYAFMHMKNIRDIETLINQPLMQRCLTIEDYDGCLPLHYICMRDYDFEFKIGDDQVLSPDKVFRRTPLHYACISGNLELVKLISNLPAANDQMNAVDKFNNTALHCAAISKRYKIIKTLVDKGADCHLKDNNGDTPLHIICRSGNIQSFNSLMATANFYDLFYIKNAKGRTPLQELEHSNGDSPHFKKYVSALYALVNRKKILSKKQDAESVMKLGHIDKLLSDLASGNVLEQRGILGGLNDAAPLFTPRNVKKFLFFTTGASKPSETETAKVVKELKQSIGVKV